MTDTIETTLAGAVEGLVGLRDPDGGWTGRLSSSALSTATAVRALVSVDPESNSQLISDGRIHPARIEDVVKKVGLEVDVTIKEAGEQAAFDLGVHGINSELIKYLGRLKFRSSYAQNVLQHSVEVGSLCGIMAAELGLKEKLAKRMGLIRALKENNWGLTVAGVSVRYRRRVRVFQKFEIHSRAVGWDERFLYLEQSIWTRGHCANQALYRTAVTGPDGIVNPKNVAVAMGVDSQSPTLPVWVENWIKADGSRPWPPENQAQI